MNPNRNKPPVFKSIAALLIIFCPWIYYLGTILIFRTPAYFPYVIIGPLTIYALALLLSIIGNDRGERDL